MRSGHGARRRAIVGALLGAVALGALTGGPAASAQGAKSPGGLVVVINDGLRLKSIDEIDIRRLFLGKSRTLPNGMRAQLASYGPERSFFNERALGLSDERVAGIWSRMQFSGRTPPPRVFDTAEEVIAFVASTPNAIAYLPASASREGVRVIWNVPR